MNPLVQRELGLLIVSVSMNLDGTGTLTFDHKHRGILKTMSFPKLPDALNMQERIIRYTCEKLNRVKSSKGHVVNFFRLSPSLVMVKAPMNYLTMIQGDGQKLNVDYATALFAELKEGRLVSDFFPLPEELEVVYYKVEDDHLVMVIEDKSR